MKKSPRKVSLALLSAIVSPGLGQLYTGQIKKAIVVLLALIAASVAFAATQILSARNTFIVIFAVVLAVHLYLIIDAVVYARKQKDYTLKKYNSWYFYLLYFIVVFFIVNPANIQRLSGIRIYRLPNTSSEPVVKSGSFLAADMRAYKTAQPDYGDLIVFEGADKIDYVYTVVGFPLDTVQVINNKVTINRVECKYTFVEKTTTSTGEPVEEYTEVFPNGKENRIYIADFPPIKYNANTIVPPDKYYVLGNNRDRSADSRYIKSIPKEKIKGKVLFAFGGK